jgi:tetratricopeptide (TPR) repeat protein
MTMKRWNLFLLLSLGSNALWAACDAPNTMDKQTVCKLDKPAIALTQKKSSKVKVDPDLDIKIENAQAALKAKIAELGQTNPKLAIMYFHLGDLYQAKNDYNQALLMYKYALTLYKKNYTNHIVTLNTIYNHLGNIYSAKQENELAEDNYKQSLALLDTEKQPYVMERFTSFNNLAEHFRVNQQSNKALLYYKMSEKLVNQFFKKDKDISYALFKNNFALFYKDQDKLEESEKLFKEALSCVEKIQGKDSVIAALTLDNMGDLAIKQARPEQARLYYEKSLRIFSKNNEADENSTRVLTKLASLGERKVY